MTIEDLIVNAKNAIDNGTRMTIVVPRPWKNRPPKFPKGELLVIQDGGKWANYSFDPLDVLAWMVANELIAVSTGAEAASN